jgi:hypothetical protein
MGSALSEVFLFNLATVNERLQYYILFVRYNNQSKTTLINLYPYSTIVTSDFVHTVLRFVGQNLFRIQGSRFETGSEIRLFCGFLQSLQNTSGIVCLQ